MGLQRASSPRARRSWPGSTDLIKAVRENPAWAGYCYTQLTDVEQEINGLMTYDRKPKVEPDVYKKILGQ